ncbi:MAG: hypothetical protein M3T55_07990 [Pseudomonadota bacterium]|nr:hypothetical protein [Pseudomonadota bacterium]
MGDTADPQSPAALRDRAFGADLDALGERLGACSSAELADPMLIEIQAVAKYRSGEVPAAVTLFSQAQAVPKHILHLKSLLFLMRGQYAAGDLEATVLTARRVIDVDSGNQEALKLAGRIYNQRQDWDRADRFWRQLCEVAPREPEAALQVARIGGRRGEWETQAFYADILLRGSPEHPEGLRLAIDGRLRAHRLEDLPTLLPALYRVDRERAHAFLRSLNRAEQAELLATILTALKAIDPDDEALRRFADEQARAWLDQALRHEIARKDELAAMLFRAARLANPALRDAADGVQRLAQESVANMREAIKARDDTAIVRHAKRVVAIDPAMTEAWVSLGRLTLTADPALAAGYLIRAAELTPDDPWVRLNQGRALERAERYVEAIDAYAAVTRLIDDPDNERRTEAAKSIVNARQKLIRHGRDAYREGRLEEAWSDYAAAAELGGASADMEAMFTAIKRAMFVALREQFRSDDADFIAAAEKYLRLDPDHAETLLYLGRKLMPARNHARALEVWRRLAALEPGEAHYQLQIARCCSWLKLKDEGAAAAGEALRLKPDLAEAATLLQQFAPA